MSDVWTGEPCASDVARSHVFRDIAKFTKLVEPVGDPGDGFCDTQVANGRFVVMPVHHVNSLFLEHVYLPLFFQSYFFEI